MKADSFLRALRAAGADAFDPAINAHHKTARVRVQLFVLWRLPAQGAQQRGLFLISSCGYRFIPQRQTQQVHPDLYGGLR